MRDSTLSQRKRTAMSRRVRLLALVGLLAAWWTQSANAMFSELWDEYPEGELKCSGMHARSSAPDNPNSFIKVQFERLDDEEQAPGVAVAVFNWADEEKLGYKYKNGTRGEYVCNSWAILEEQCSEEQMGTIIVPEGDKTSIRTRGFNFSAGADIADATNPWMYAVNMTGYYCVVAFRSPITDKKQFEARVEWQNPFGKLPAADYPKLIFYGVLSLVYLAIGIAWGTLSIKHRKELLAIQNYIGGMIAFLIVELAVNWGYWNDYNNTGTSSTVLLCMVSVLNAGRNSISFFTLLIVCMGYGVVVPSLGSTMNKCRALAGAHFVFGIIYSAGTLMDSPETMGALAFLVIFPLALTMTAFYVWTLQSLANTIQYLEERKQTVKVLMYRRVYRLIVFSVSVLCIFFVVNSINLAHRADPKWIGDYWHYKWFLLDGWLNILYLIVFSVIAYLWRPTENNKRFAMSEQLRQGDDEFDEVEINNLGAAHNLGFDQVKFRDRSSAARSGNSLDESGAIFDIGELDGEDTPRQSVSSYKEDERTPAEAGSDLEAGSPNDDDLTVQQQPGEAERPQ